MGIFGFLKESNLNSIKGTKGSLVPFLVMYTYVLIYFFCCKCTMSNMQKLKHLFERSGQDSSQIINHNKVTIYTGLIPKRGINKLLIF